MCLCDSILFGILPPAAAHPILEFVLSQCTVRFPALMKVAYEHSHPESFMFLSDSTLSYVKYSFQLFGRKGVWAAPLHLFWCFWFVCFPVGLAF